MSIDIDHLRNVCLIGKGNACCRYVVADRSGINCGKDKPEIKQMLDERVGSMVAKADCCVGWNKFNKGSDN